MAAPNGELDPWADWIVSQKFLRYVQVSGYYDQTADVTTAQDSEPAGKCPRQLDGGQGADNMEGADRGGSGRDPRARSSRLRGGGRCETDDRRPRRRRASTTEGPPLVPKSDGSIWLISSSAGSAARDRLWQMLMDPGLRPLKSPSYKRAPGRPVARIMHQSAGPQGASCSFHPAWLSSWPPAPPTDRAAAGPDAAERPGAPARVASAERPGRPEPGAATPAANCRHRRQRARWIGHGWHDGGRRHGARHGPGGKRRSRRRGRRDDRCCRTRRHWAGGNRRRGNPHLHDPARRERHLSSMRRA